MRSDGKNGEFRGDGLMAVTEYFYKNRLTSGLMNTISKKKHDEKLKTQRMMKIKADKMLQDTIDAALPISFKPSDDGEWIETNGTFIKCMVIGRISPKYGDRQDFPTEMDCRFMDEIFEIATKKETCIELCQIIYPLNPLKENESLEIAKKNIKIQNAIQEDKDKVTHTHDTINDFAAEGIYQYQKDLYHGKTRLFHHVLLVAVQGVTKKDVSNTLYDIETVCDRKIIQHEIPIRGMAETYKSMQPTPYVWSNLFKKSVNAELCAKTSLLRSPEPVLSTQGRMLGINPRTGNPILYDFDNPNVTNSNAFEIGVSGSGKSVDLLKDDIRAFLDGDHVIHIVPKKDGITDHLRVCAALNGQLWKIGFKGQNPNLFQVFFDPSTMDNSEEGYQDAYLAHFTMLLEVIGLLVGSGYSDQQKNWLTEALSELYTEFNVINASGLIRLDNVHRWDDGTYWPNFTNLRNKLWNWLNDDMHKKMSGPIEALYNNTSMLTPNGPLGYLVNNNVLDLSNPFIMADLSALSSVPNVQEALTLMIMSVVYTKLAHSRPGAPKVRTLLTLDEGADLVKNKTMKGSIEKFFRQGRSWGLYTKVVSQDLAGYPREMLDMMKANCSYVLLFGNMRSDNVEPIKKEFKLNDKDVQILLTPGKGHGLMIMSGHKIPYYNALDDFEHEIILGKSKLEIEAENEAMLGEIVLNPLVERVVRELGVSCKTWYNKPLDPKEYPNGYEKETSRNPCTGLQTVVFFKKTLVDEDGKIKGQTKEHYLMNALLAGEGYIRGAETVTVDNNYGREQLPDVVMTFPQADGTKIKIPFEYETRECKHSIKDLQKKRDDILLIKVGDASCFRDVKFIGKKDYVYHLIEAVGDDFVLTRGAAVGEYIETMKAYKPLAHMPQIDE
jgi:hypothetical protein